MIDSLYDCFKHWCKSGSIWILSDMHFDDENSHKMNPTWISSQEQINIINKKVYKNDTFICLGDVGNPEWVKKIKAHYKVLIMGNHDTARTKLLEYFDEVYEGPLFISSKILLSHEPINVPNNFAANIHGHVHKPCIYASGFRHVNLAANMCNYTPVNLNELIKNGLVSKIENIHRITINNVIINKAKRERNE